MKKTANKDIGSFDSLYILVCSVLSSVPDIRKDNSSYQLSDMLKTGFAMFSLKCPSLLNFMGRTKAEDSNLKSIYKIGSTGSENGLRKTLDNVSPMSLSRGFKKLWNRLRNLGILKEYCYWNDYLIISVDGVEHYCSNKISCKHCLERKVGKNGKGFFHSMLSAVLVHPEEKEVFVIGNEPIVREDGAKKNDCERTAGKRLLTALEKSYSKETFLFVMDALYSCAPIIRAITKDVKKRWQYIINIKPKGNVVLFSQFENRKKRGRISYLEIKEQLITHCFSYTNNLPLNSSNSDIRVNILYYQQFKNGQLEKTFSWITAIKLSKANVYKVMKMGRSRWKIENETFNTLKNQGYHFEHNYGHGKNNLCTIFSLLMMLAFSVDQIQQHSCNHFQKIRNKLKTKVKLWENLRATFKILPFKSMEMLFFKIAELNDVQLE